MRKIFFSIFLVACKPQYTMPVGVSPSDHLENVKAVEEYADSHVMTEEQKEDMLQRLDVNRAYIYVVAAQNR